MLAVCRATAIPAQQDFPTIGNGTRQPHCSVGDSGRGDLAEPLLNSGALGQVLPDQTKVLIFRNVLQSEISLSAVCNNGCNTCRSTRSNSSVRSCRSELR